MAKVEEMLKMIEDMTVLELSELVTACEDKFGVKAAAPVAAAGAPAAAAVEESEGECQENGTWLHPAEPPLISSPAS